jgi:hypothetical protein
MRMEQITLGLAVLVSSSQYSHAYTMNYYDCTKPTGMTEFDLKTYCTREKFNIGETNTYHVLQKRKGIKMSGFSCQIIRSTFVVHCGMFSHNEVIRMPDIEIKQVASIQECQAMITTGYWATREGTRHKVIIGAENVIHVSEKGMLHESNHKIWCEGEALKINGNLIEGVLKMVQYRLTIEEEDYMVDKKRVEVIDSHIRLPSACTVESGGCVARKTYLWNPPSNQCPLVKINTGKFTEEQGWLIEHRAKLLFKITDTSQSPSGCPNGDVHHTEYEDLFLTKENNFPHIGQSLEIGLYVKQSADYVLFETERMTRAVSENTFKDICHQIYTKSKDEVIPMGNGKFGRRSGDVLYHFNCVRKTGKLLSGEKCFDRVPLQNQIYVDPVTKIGTRHATVTECNSVFPEAISSMEGWISLPELRPIKEPNQVLNVKKNQSHEDMSRGGLYTKEELADWEMFISYGDFKTSLISSISTGACVHRDICKSSNTVTMPSYNLNRLIEEAQEQMNVLARIDHFIRTNGAYLSFIVIMVWIARAGLWIALLFNTVVREGKNVAVALLYATCCGTLYKTGRIVKHNNKKRATSAPQLDELKDFNPILRPI